MPEKDACTGIAGAAERGLESAARHGREMSTLDIINILAGRGISPKEGEANIAAFNKCNEQRTQADPTLPKLHFDPIN